MVLLQTLPFAIFFLYLGWKDVLTFDLPESIVGLLWAYTLLVLAFQPPIISFYTIALLCFFWLLRLVSIQIGKLRKIPFIHKKLKKSFGELGMGDVFVAPPFVLASVLEFGLIGASAIVVGTLVVAEIWHQFNLRNPKKRVSHVPLVTVASVVFLAGFVVQMFILILNTPTTQTSALL